MKRQQQHKITFGIVAILLFALSLLPGNTVLAHASLLDSSPGDHQILSRSPSFLRLHFSEPLQEGLYQVRLLDAQGKQIPLSPRTDRRDASRIITPLPSLPKGTYTVSWNVVSGDGHSVAGALTFSVGHPSPDQSAPLPTQKSASVNWLSTGWHFISETAVLLLGGLNWAVFLFSLHTPSVKNRLGKKKSWLLLLFLVILADGILYMQTLAAGVGTEVAWLTLLKSHYIQMIAGQLLLLLLLALPNMVEGWYLAVWLLLICSFAFGGHVWSVPDFWPALFLRIIHTGAIALWLGILAYLILLYRLKRTENITLNERVLHSEVFHLASTSALSILITGVWMVTVQSDWRLVPHGGLWSALLWSKLTLFGLMLLIGLVQTINGRKKGTYRRSLLWLEWLAGVTVLFLGVWLSHSAYPAPIQRYDKILLSQEQKAQVTIARLQTGRQPIAVKLPPNSPEPERVTVQVSVTDRQVKFAPVLLQKKGSNEYSGTVSFTFNGKWRIYIEAEYPDGTYGEWKDEVEVQGGERS
ncbi:copper resistance protein CopC [Thermoactinomyces sp. CICC 10521]|uniref:copper resistance CopC/CopD family protein n=1 Tax=Thermoactinomyces sp. CICC 10521 TaxID=2767426 RepID=UPI0018DCA9FA|nr:copper resistance protein CopC [Thermoactinomyces sp. CICC 10521]MBH8608629.1 copper resistance protein CopC [Thermoactinomyces sp. CICC 10521]